jgi:hypothetical protein
LERYYGIYRAQVINNKDPDKKGRVKIWIPDIMPTVDKSVGIWARPGNNPVGGRNVEGDSAHHFSGTSYIPLNGSWVFIFFEGGNPNRPYYLSALDIENTTVLPENQKGTNYELKWTIFKSHMGRCIVISCDPDDERVEITSKKRTLTGPPTGDLDSVYTIDGNQTTVLLDERSGKEKLLIRTRKGDFLHIDIDEQKFQAYFKSDIHILTDANLYMTAKGNMHLKSYQNLKLESVLNTDLKTGLDLRLTSGMNTHIKATINLNMQASVNANLLVGALLNIQALGSLNVKSGLNLSLEGMALVNVKCAGPINTDGAVRNDQMKMAMPAGPAGPATIAETATDAAPQGERDT